MQQKAIVLAAMALLAGACATGTAADSRDGGVLRPDAGKGNDGSTTLKDSGTAKDSSSPIVDGSTCSLTVCGTLCVDTTIDDNNCGQCNHVCPSGSSCSNSQCQCGTTATLCGSSCVDTMNDVFNCGSCNNACGTGQSCVQGMCQSQASGAPPQGTCSHDLCSASLGPLTQGCDGVGCVTSVCNNDTFCCDTDWDSLCVGEVTTYCSPYTCP